MRRLLFLVLIFLASTMPLLAADSVINKPGESRLIFYPIGNDSHFAVKITMRKKDGNWYYYRSHPVTLKNPKITEWVSSYVSPRWTDEVSYDVFAWGKVNGTGKEISDRFEFFDRDRKGNLVFTWVTESRLARLMCATAETGRNLNGIAAYRKWAGASIREMQEWEALSDYLVRNDAGNNGRQGRNIDLYSIFTGISAIRETLQTDASLDSRNQERDPACMASQRTVMSAVEMYNMDQQKLMNELDMQELIKNKYLKKEIICHSGQKYYGKDLTGKGYVRCPLHGDFYNPRPDPEFEAVKTTPVKVASLEVPKAPSHPWRKMIKNPDLKLPEVYSMVPGDCAFIHFPSYSAFRKAFDFFADWATALGSLAGADSGNSNFGLEQRVKEQLLLKTDILTRLLADMALSDMVFVAEDPFIFEGSAFAVYLKITNEAMLREKLAMTAAEFCSANPGIKQTTIKMQGRDVQVFASDDFRFRSYRIIAGNHQILCNSPVLLEKIIAVIDRKLPALTAAFDLHYFYEHMEKNFVTADRVFSFLSDAFIRKLIGPAYKIATSRRLECIRNSLLQTHEIVAGDKLNPALNCPAGAKYEFVDGEMRCPVHRAFGRMTPVSENLPLEVTQSEASAYSQFVNQYNQYFSQFFDPIGLVFTTDPEFKARLLIMPLVENGVYSGLQQNLRHEPMNPGPRLKSAILKIGANLRTETLPLPGYWVDSPSFKERLELARRCFTGCLWAHLADHQLLFHWDSNVLAREILDALGGGPSRDFASIAPAVLSFFSPVLFAFELNGEEKFQVVIDWIGKEIEENRISTGFLRPDIQLDRLEENGVEMYVFSFDLFAVRKNWYLTCRDGFLLVASRKDLLFDLAPASEKEKEVFNGNFNLLLYPENIKLMRSDLIESRASSQREACLKNLKNLCFVATFKPEEVLKYYRILYSADPGCPAGGHYSTGLPVSCDVHGTINGGALKTVPNFFDGKAAISIQSFIDSDGFQSEIKFIDK